MLTIYEVDSQGVWSCTPALNSDDVISFNNTQGLSARARKAIMYLGVKRWAGLAACNPDEVLEQRQCGKATLNELRAVLLLRGLDFTDWRHQLTTT